MIQRLAQNRRAPGRTSATDALDVSDALDALADAVIGSDESGTIRYANPAAARLLGWTVDDLRGKPLVAIMPERLHTAHRAGFDRFMRTHRSTIIGRPIRVPALHRDGSEIQVELTLSALPGPGLPVIAVLRDLRDRVELERKVAGQRKILAQYAAVGVLAEAKTAAEAMPRILHETAEALGWDLAIYWALDPGTGRLSVGATWSSGLAGSDTFLDACRALSFGPGDALPGMVLETRDALWSRDLPHDPRARRASLAAAHGFRSALLFPVYCSHRMWGVLEYVTRWEDDLDEELRQTMKALGFQIGQFLERMKNEEDLRHAWAQANVERRNLQKLFEDAPAAIAILRGPELRYELSNKINQELAGGRALVGRTVREALPSLEADGVAALVRRVYETGEPYHAHEYPVTLPEAPGRPARVIFMNGVCQPLLGAAGETEGAMVFAYEVTDLVASRERVKEAEERLRLAVESAAVGTWDYDPRDGTLRSDARYRSLFGVGPNSPLTTESVSAAIHPDDRARAMEETRRAFDSRTGGEYASEYRTRGIEDNVERWVAVRGRMLFDDRGEPQRFVGTGVDITQERRALDRLRFLAEASTILAAGLDHRAALASLARLVVPHLADWCAIELEKDEGRTEQVALAHVDPAKAALARELRRRLPDAPFMRPGLGQVLATGEPLVTPAISDEMLVQAARDDFELRVLRQLGPRQAVLLPLRARDRVLGVLTLVQAESGRRFTPEDVRFAEELARRAAVALDNALLYDRATAALSVRDEFLSVASHELRTPLTSLILQLSGLKRLAEGGRMGAVPTDKLVGRLALMDKAASRLSALVDELLDISRLRTGRLELAQEPMDLVALAQEIAARLAAQARRAGVTLRVVAPGPVWGTWDRSRLDQVITNIVGNAVKYAPGKPVEIEVTDTGAAAALTVRDGGPGISEADQRRIFDQFERAAPRALNGLGLGLWIANRIVEAHGGRIQVTSRPGDGASFTVHLPKEVRS